MKNKHLKKVVQKLIEASFKDGKMIESQVAKSIKILKGLPVYQSIESLGEYLKQLKRLERQFTMVIESSTPLSTIQVKKIKRLIEKDKKITKIITKNNPEILGGFKLKIGDEIWDESLLGKINQVKNAIIGEKV